VLEVGGHLSGDVVRPGQQAFFRVRIRAWASGAIDERLTRVELIRNGEVVKTIEAGQKATELDRIFDITETGRAWYIARCYGSNNHQIAVTNPVYVEPEGARPPAAALAEVELSVRDLATGAPLSGDCEVIRMVGRRAVRESEVAFKAGRLRLRVPATARLEVRVPGYSSMTRSIFMDYAPLRESVFSMRAEGLSEWSAFEHVRELLKSVRLDFALRAIQ
ncbi:MAG TPA: hypothetical protein VE398_16985, partial [Acidobacteriota bacterium]|nr:hypothetical protein [Acidobacteriota bacterium]